MLSAKRKIWAEHTESKKKKKKKKQKKKAATERKEDRLSDLPEELKLHILACLDMKQAVQTTILSRSWVSLWTRIPVLQFSHFYFPNYDPRRFRKFVRKVLNRRDPLAKLDSLKFYYKDEDEDDDDDDDDDDDLHRTSCSAKILKRVFDYAFSHGVKHLEASTDYLCENDSWPVSLCDSLTSLKLRTWCGDMIRCPFLGPRSVLFKNLTVLHLRDARITDVDPFSGFPVLERLILYCCELKIEGKITLRVHAFRLSYLFIYKCRMGPCWELRTPRLRCLEYWSDYPKNDESLPVLKHDEGLPVLETVKIVSTKVLYFYPVEKQQFDDLLTLFSTLHNIKSLTLSCDAFFLLLFFSDELVRPISSPFRELKDLKLRCYYHNCNNLPSWVQSASRESFECVKAYFLQNSPRGNLTIIDFPVPRSKSCTCFRFLRINHTYL